jgi:antitoxin component YwqK of YwqJK toxin-antitoxin module
MAWVSEHYWLNGNLSERDTYDGEVLTMHETWHPNGHRWVTQRYDAAGLRHGIQEAWFEDDQLCSRTEMAHGKKDGLSETWHDGFLRNREAFEEDQSHGLYEKYDLDGGLVAKRIYVRGKRATVVEYALARRRYILGARK